MPAGLQREREGGGAKRLVPAAHPDGDWGTRLSPGEGLGLHRTGVTKRVIRTAVPLHQVCLIHTNIRLYPFTVYTNMLSL